MAKAPKWGVNTYVESTKPQIGRHKKRMNNTEDKGDEIKLFTISSY
jgi:predicted metal-dependent phosphotriesterase family hydrolase